MVGMGLGQWLMGPLSDAYGRKKIMLSSIGLYTLASLLCALATSAWFLLAARGIQAISASGCLVVGNAIIRDSVHSSKSAFAYSILNGINSLAPLIAPKLGAYLYISTHRWQATFLFLVIFGMIEIPIVAKFLDETLSKEDRLPVNMKNWCESQMLFISNNGFLIYAYAATIGMSCLFDFFSISPILLISNLNVSVSNFGYYFAINAMTFIVATIFCTIFQKLLSNLNILRLGMSIIAIGSWVMLYYSKIHELSTSVFMAPMCIVTFGAGFIFGPAIALAMLPFGKRAGYAAATYGVIQYSFAAIIGSYIVYYPVNDASSFGITIGTLALISVFLLFMLKNTEINNNATSA